MRALTIWLPHSAIDACDSEFNQSAVSLPYLNIEVKIFYSLLAILNGLPELSCRPA